MKLKKAPYHCLKNLCIVIIYNLLIVPGGWSQDYPEGRRLRTIVADRYPEGNLFIGSASHHYLLKTHTASILASEFSYVTPANRFKQSYIHPDPDTWRWEDCDYWVDFARKNNQVMRLHAPISPQSSTWAKSDDRTAEELKEMLEEYMTAICKRYNDSSQIRWLDVVNEIVNPDGTWFGPKEGTDSWENPWPAIGFDDDPNNTPLYIKYAFQIADSLAPDLKLIINQHGSMQSVMWEKIKETVVYLRDLGLRVDGIGWQAHVNTGWENKDDNLDKLKSLIEWAHANNLEFHVTENNAWLQSWEWDDTNLHPVSDEKREENFVRQGETFAAIVRTMLPYRKSGVVSWNLWHIQDDECQGYQWGKSGCLWTTTGEPKPGYYQVQRVLELGEDSTRYTVHLTVVDKDTKDTLHSVNTIMNGEMYESDNESGIHVSGLLADRYIFDLSSKHYEEVRKELYLYSDTSLVIELPKKFYKVSFVINNHLDGSLVSGVDVVQTGNACISNLNGKCNVDLAVGTYMFTFNKKGFSGTSENFDVRSDTTINIQLEQTHGTVKFRIMNGSTPVNNAEIIVDNDTIITNSVGVAAFDFLPIGAVYSYTINKENYQAIDSVFWVSGDITFDVNIQKVVYIPNDLEQFPIQIFPMPVKDYLHIDSGIQIEKFTILDICGTTHRHLKLDDRIDQVYVGDLCPGVYVLQLVLDGKKVHKKIVIR